MLLLPVLDLLGGTVVRGIAGQRDQYRPLISQLAKNATPAAVLQGLLDKFPLSEIYVADLDAIAGRPLQQVAYQQLATVIAGHSQPLRVWLDAGIGNVETWLQVATAAESVGLDCDWIIGLESLASPASLAPIMKHASAARCVFSLDLKAGVPQTKIPAWQSLSARQIADAVIDLGIRRMILLDLADVGMAGGTRTRQLCRELTQFHGDVRLTSGGGVRSREDLADLYWSGCEAALLAL